MSIATESQRKNSILKRSLQLSEMTAKMNPEQKQLTANIIKECDLARLMKGTTIQKELKRVRGDYKGKIKLFLTALSQNEYAMSGVDFIHGYEVWKNEHSVNL